MPDITVAHVAVEHSHHIVRSLPVSVTHLPAWWDTQDVFAVILNFFLGILLARESPLFRMFWYLHLYDPEVLVLVSLSFLRSFSAWLTAPPLGRVSIVPGKQQL